VTTQETISKLEGLLARIQKNARGARPAAPATTTTAAPAGYAAQPAPPPVAFASPASLPAAPPPPMVGTPPMPYAVPVPVPAPSAADQSLDELLSPAPEQSVDIDVPLDTIPPVAESGAPETDPIPLVAVAPEPPAPPAPEDPFSLESEVSEVRFAAGPRDSDVEVTVAAIEAEAETIATEELSEADLVELTESQPPAAAAASDVDIDFDDEEEEQPPASSQRSRVASTMDEALAAAAQQEAEHEVPLKTPPPESGPQEAPVVALPSSSGSDVDALLGQELDIPTRADGGPTAEQLGQTIDLDEARGPSLELAEPAQSSVPPAGAEDLEVALPSREVVSGYADDLLPPPEARDDLEAHRRRQESDIAPPPESLAQLPSMQPGAALPEIVPIQAAPAATIEPEVTLRPAADGAPESFVSVREDFRPASFVELLDASLRLGS
jgi:hypothetical protein